ncbi:MAG: hypothetical protein OD811_04765, partial [Alphaproteobacteria bacterium]
GRLSPFAGLAQEHLLHHVDAPGFVAHSLWPGRVILLRGEELGLLRAIERLSGFSELLIGGVVGVEGGGSVLRVGPDLAYVVLPAGGEEDGRSVAESLGGIVDLALDLSEERVVVGMSGHHFEDVWSQFCPLDLHDSVFGDDRVAGTIAAQVSVVLWRSAAEWRVADETLPWRVMFRRSYVAWFYGLLARAARPYGFRID